MNRRLLVSAIVAAAFIAVGYVALEASGWVSTQSFVEDNDLWMEDDVKSSKGITEAQFNAVIQAGQEMYQPLATAAGETLTIANNWADSTVNASCGRFFTLVMINMYGGLARREEVTPEGFALVLCHELGHAYGGRPYVQEFNKMAAEGQSDWYGAKECLRKVLPKIGSSEIELTSYIETRCAALYDRESSEFTICTRSLAGGQSLGTLLATLKNEPLPNFETPDPTVVATTQLSYPATVQCRPDNYHNGALNMDRPACWFKN